MRISRVSVENFRAIKSVDCRLDDLTVLLGPNGAGKSTILRAVDWCLNGEKGSLSSPDRFAGCSENEHIRVKVEFSELTPTDRELLGDKYAPEGTDTFSVWRTWTEEGEKLTGRAFAYPEFEAVRAHATAGDRRQAYSDLAALHPELGLPHARSAQLADVAMDDWERKHPEALREAEVSDTHIFGFAGQGRLGELVDYVFVSADLRADEEVSDSKGSILSRILERAIDRSALDLKVEQLLADFKQKHCEASREHLDGQLTTLAESLTEELSQYSRGRRVLLSAGQPPLRPAHARISLEVEAGGVQTAADRQGHGFQRTMLVAALTVLSRKRAESSTQLFLAIEEPELYQHPTQARAFASVLRALTSTEGGQAMQVAYATHSPYFVDPRWFDQVRRVTSVREGGDEHPSTRITEATLDSVKARLDGYIKDEAIDRRWDQVCLSYLSEALFAEYVMLVEGDDDAAVLQGLSERGENQMAVQGICVAAVGGKSNMMIPFAVLDLLGINTLMVVDNDSGCGARMAKMGRDVQAVEDAVAKHRRDNRALCRLLGVPDEDYPRGLVESRLFFVPDTLETVLAEDVPGWGEARRKIVEEGRGVAGKHAATYLMAAKECAVDLPKSSLWPLFRAAA